jgi:hypothetical protein
MRCAGGESETPQFLHLLLFMRYGQSGDKRRIYIFVFHMNFVRVNTKFEIEQKEFKILQNPSQASMAMT